MESFWNGPAAPPLTMEALVETARKLDALPKVPRDITASPDVVASVWHSGLLETASLLSVRVWQDATLPRGTWHLGKPLAEQLRAALPALPVFARR